MQLTAVPKDVQGNALSRQVSWATSNAAVATVSPTGMVAAIALGGPVSITATAEGKSGSAAVTVRAQAVNAMLQDLPSYIVSAVAYNESLLPNNPSIATQIQTKLMVLRTPTLASDIVNGQLYSESNVSSRNARRIPIITVFMLDSMRTGASQAVLSIALAVPLLEDFFVTPFPTDVIRVWYGFVMGNRGGGGTIYTEDQGTYEARTPPTRLLHEAIIDHELSHSYIAHESLNQFLELYVYNMVHTNSATLQSWTYTRRYVHFAATNTGVHALLDVYQLIGWEAMANAYRTIYPLRPPYGVTLSLECKQAFVDQAPATLKTQVSDLVSKVTF